MALQQILSLLSRWEYGLTPHGAWIKVPNVTIADFVIDMYYDQFVQTAQKLNGIIEIFYGEDDFFIIHPWMKEDIMNSPSSISAATNTLWFGNNLQVDSELLRLAQGLLENPRSSGIVDLKTERQIVLHDQAQSILKFNSPGEATNWTRGQYWNPQNLIDFRRFCRQEMSPGNIKEYKYTAFDPTLGPNDPTIGNWLELTTRYQIADLGNNRFYQIFETLEIKEMQTMPSL